MKKGASFYEALSCNFESMVLQDRRTGGDKSKRALSLDASTRPFCPQEEAAPTELQYLNKLSIGRLLDTDDCQG